MTKRTKKQIETIKLLALVAAMGISITAVINTEQAFAFNLSESAPQTPTQKVINITSDESGDCDMIGQWNQHNKTCIIYNKITVGVNDIVHIQPNAVLEIPSNITAIIYGTIENRGSLKNHGHIFNHGIIENFKMISNDGMVKNYWGKINNNEGALLVNGGYMSDGKIGLHYIGTIDNHYGIIKNNGIMSNHSTLNNNWGTIFNNCLGSIVGTGHTLGNDIKQAKCVITIETDKL